MSNQVIPLLDFSQYSLGYADRMHFAADLGAAFRKIGFVRIVNHGIPQSLIDAFYADAYAFFRLPTETKLKYEIEGLAGQRGYTAFGKEHAKQSQVADLKEFFQIGQVTGGHYHRYIEYPDNVQVAEVPTFAPTGWQLYQAFERVGSRLLEAISIDLRLRGDYFHQYVENGNSILRAIHYPPITHEPASAIRAEQHEDINLITLLVGASAGGLQLQNMDGEWLEINPQANEIVVNVGDMLQRLTNNYYKSTTHRVVNPPRELWHTPRLSIPFFLHPRKTMDLTCLRTCTMDRPPAYPPITAGEYLEERLREIGLTK